MEENKHLQKLPNIVELFLNEVDEEYLLNYSYKFKEVIKRLSVSKAMHTLNGRSRQNYVMMKLNL